MNFYLLGLMHGHFQTPTVEALHDPLIREKLNMGIGIVVPSDHIAETLNEEYILKKEKEGLEKLREQSGTVTPDTGFSQPESESARAFTQEDFVNALKKASKKIDPK
jgi:hypothetical protein